MGDPPGPINLFIILNKEIDMFLEERREEGWGLLRFLIRILGSRILSPPCFRVRVSYASWGLEFDHPRVLDFCHPRVSSPSFVRPCLES